MAAPPIQPRPEGQHYVPAGYLRGFLPDGERALHVRRRAASKWFRQVPENIATRRNFYSVLREGRGWDDQLEHILARHIEGPGLRALQSLTSGKSIPGNAKRQRIAILMAMQYLRIPQLRDDMDRVLQEFFEGFAEHTFADEDGIALDLQHLRGVEPVEARQQARELRHALATGGVEVKIRREAALPYIFGLLGDGVRLFDQFDWTVHLSEAPAFYTCDRPVYISPSSVREGEVIALVSPGIRIHWPLTSRRFLVLSNFGVQRSRSQALAALVGNLDDLPPVVNYAVADVATVERMNSETARTCEEWICGAAPSAPIDAALRLPQSRVTLEIVRSREGMLIQQRLVER